MIYPENTVFLIICLAIFGFAIFCLFQGMLFGAMSCFILSICGFIAHFRERKAEKKRKQESDE